MKKYEKLFIKALQPHLKLKIDKSNKGDVIDKVICHVLESGDFDYEVPPRESKSGYPELVDVEEPFQLWHKETHGEEWCEETN